MAVVWLAWRRSARMSGQVVLAPLVLRQPSVMLSPKATMAALWGASTSTSLEEGVDGVGEALARVVAVDLGAGGGVAGLEGEVVGGEGGDLLGGYGEGDGEVGERGRG